MDEKDNVVVDAQEPFALCCPRCRIGLVKYRATHPKWFTCGVCGSRTASADWSVMTRHETLEIMVEQKRRAGVRRIAKLERRGLI